MAVLALAAGYAMSWLWWDVGFDTHLLGQYHGVSVGSWQVLPILTGIAAMALLARNNPSAGLTCCTTEHRATAAALALAASLSSVMTPVVRMAFCAVPLAWIPRGAAWVAAGSRLQTPLGWDICALMWMQCAPVLAVTMVAIAACGRLVGVVAGFGAYALLLLAASWRPIAALSPLAWDSSGYTGGRMIAVSAMFLAACVLQWACQRRGWAIVMPFLS